MQEKIKDRFFITGLLITLAFSALLFQLTDIQLLKGEEFLTQSQERKHKILPLKGTRGKILDRNSVPLAYNQKSYDVEFFKDPSKNTKKDRQMYTGVIQETIRIIEKNGGRLAASFAIAKDERGEFQFQWGNISSEAAKRRDELWRKNMFIKKDIAPKAIYESLRERFQIPEDISDDEALKILAIWQEVQLSAFRAYIPVKVARNVNMTTVAEVETDNMELVGMNIAESTARVYPKGSLAAHTIGYMGKIYDEKTIKEYERKGYSREDLIGVSGIESSMESYLTGNTKMRQGERAVEVNSRGKVTRELSISYPTPGENIVLTLDTKLQKKLEEVLEQNIKDIHQFQIDLVKSKQEEYNQKMDKRDTPIRTAETGAAVVMDVKTGEVLAMANYPTYNLNLFVDGISHEDYELIRQDKRNPMFNRAISSKGTPGSIFKMVTGLAGLMEKKVSLNETIDDQGEYTENVDKNLGGRGPKCWVNPNFFKHKDQDIIKALKNSCNYYFFTVSSRLKIDLLNKWTGLLGLTSKTGIELPGEIAGQVGNQETLYNPTQAINQQKTSRPVLVANQIKKMIKDSGEKAGVSYEEKDLDQTILKLFELVNENTNIGPEIRNILKDQLKMPNSQIRISSLDSEIAGYLAQIRWNFNETITTGIGQSVTTVSPIAVARYISALVNGGKVMEAHVVKQVLQADGKVLLDKKPKIINELDIPSAYLQAIKEGMREVISGEDGGTAADYFKDFQYYAERYGLGGKTGTAQVSDIDIENNAWFVSFSPFQDPEIAVAVFIPNGYSGSKASYTAKEITKFYLDQKEKTPDNNISPYNTLVQ